MSSQKYQRRRLKSCKSSPLTRALSAACLAGASALSTAFVTPSFHRLHNDAATPSAPSISRVNSGSASFRHPRLPILPAVAEAPSGSQPTAASTVTGGGGRKRGRVPPLTVDEEKALLMKIQEARLLRGMQKNLAIAEGGGMVTVEAWARGAGLEVEELTRTLQEGVEAKRALVERNMPMVLRVIEQQYRWRLRGGQLSVADLLQEGAYALGVAADRFDPAMPNRFLTYAVFIVREKLDIAIASGNMAVSVPVSALKELHQARRNLTQELGRKPTEAELANFFANGAIADLEGEEKNSSDRASSTATTYMDGNQVLGEFSGAPESIEVEGVKPRIRQRRLDLLMAVHKVTSLDALIQDGEGNSIPVVDTIVGHHGDPVRMPGNGDMSALLPQVLTRKQAHLVRMACGLVDGRPLTMVECSKRLSLSVSRTKALFDSSLEKLRAAATAENPTLFNHARVNA